MDEKGEKKWRGPCEKVQIVDIQHIKGEKEGFYSSPIIKYL
jgi:hypothetical protein